MKVEVSSYAKGVRQMRQFGGADSCARKVVLEAQDEIEGAMLAALVQSIVKGGDPWTALHKGCDVFADTLSASQVLVDWEETE